MRRQLAAWLVIASAIALTAGAQTTPYPAKPVRIIVGFAQGGRTGSRRRGWCWGGDGVQPPGWWHRLAATLIRGVCAIALVVAMPVVAQTYPAKPVRIIVGFAPGGPNDTQARLVGQKLSEALGQSVIVDNRPGADGIIGADFVAKSPPDGYTLILVSAGHTINPSFNAKLPYNAIDDFTPIIQLSRSPFVLVVHPSLPVRSTREFIDFVKARPGQLNYGSAGTGSSLQLAMELFKNMAHIDIVHVAYKGGAPATTDLIAGQVQAMINNIVSTLPPARAGKLRALAVTSGQRFAAVPELPAVAETVPGYEVNAWYGILGPRGMPADITSKLNGEINKVLAPAEIRQRLLAMGLEAVGGPPQQLAAHMKGELAKWAKVIKETGLRAE